MLQNSSTGPCETTPYTFPAAGGQTPMTFNVLQVQTERKVHRNYESKCVQGLSVAIILLGCLCFVVQVIEIFLVNLTGPAGTGVWSGVFFIIIGVLGIISSRERTTCSIVAFLVMSIFGAVISFGPLTAGGIGWGISDTHYYNYGDKYGRGYFQRFYNVHRRVGGLAMNAIMTLAAFILFILSIIAAAYACHGLCPDKSSRGNLVVPGQVQYVTGADGQRQMVIMPMSGPTHFQMSNNPGATTAMQFLTANQTFAVQASTSAPDELPHLPAYGHQPPTPPPRYEETQSSAN